MTTEATHTFFSFQRIKFAADLKVFFVPNFLVYVCERCRDREKERRVRKSARRKYTKGDPRDGFHTVLSVTGPSFSLPTQNPSLWLRRNSIKSNIDRREEEKKSVALRLDAAIGAIRKETLQLGNFRWRLETDTHVFLSRTCYIKRALVPRS